MRGPKHTSASSSRSSDSILTSREAIKIEYKERVLNAFTHGDMLVEDGNDMNFFLTPNTDGLNISNFVHSADIKFFGVQPNNDILFKNIKYTVMTAVNAIQLKNKIDGLEEMKRAETIVLVNRVDPVELRQIQASQVACVKAIIWYNATWRGQHFQKPLTSSNTII